jgi:hypothetical protein
MDRDLFSSTPVRVALVAVAVALGIAAWTANRAIAIEPIVSAPPPTFATAGALAKAPSVSPANVGAVVSQNAFSPDRKAPARRYKLTGYAEAAPAAAIPLPVVLGTSVADDNRSFAYVSVGDSRATVVRAGDKISGYTVKSIARGSVTFVTPSGEPLVVNAARL